MDLIERAAKKLEEQKNSPLAEAESKNASDFEFDENLTDRSPADGPGTTPSKADGSKQDASARADSRQKGRPATKVDLDLKRLEDLGYLTPKKARGRKNEEYRSIKRPLLRLAFGGEKGKTSSNNMIMVTSALPSEGKTFTAINLAMSMTSERDVHVLLIDADLSRPNASRTLGVEDRKGLSDLLENDELNVGDVILRTSIENLSIIPAGVPHELGTELLASERARQITEEIAIRYPNRVILFDSSPLLATGESGALSRNVGQVVFVVEYAKTKETSIRAALDIIADCENVGMVLNKVTTRISRKQMGMYDNYYYYRPNE